MQICTTKKTIEIYFDAYDTVAEYNAMESSIRATFATLQRIKEVEDQLAKNKYKD
jgi:hypothetical protein